jgi:hypothetical protein
LVDIPDYGIAKFDMPNIEMPEAFPQMWKGFAMAKVKYISTQAEIFAGGNYVLVLYGEEYAQTRHPLGLAITVARQQSKTVSELSFLTAVHTAKGIAKQEGISRVFACK